MQISWKCLNQLIDLTDISPLDIADKLTLAGFEINNIIHKNNIEDTILDISITANRQDVIGTISIAVELSSILKRSLKLDLYTKLNITTQRIKNAINLSIFQELYTCIIKDIPITCTNKHITNQSIDFNFKVIHRILDIIQLINFKWGQDIHIYKLPNNDNRKDYYFNFKLNQLTNNLEIYANKSIINPISYRNINQHKNISKILLINYKYKNNLSKNNKHISHKYCIYAYQDIFNRLNILFKNIPITNILCKYNNSNKSNNIIVCQIKNIHRILGPTTNNKQTLIEKNKIINILQNLNFNIYENNNILYIQTPQERNQDIEHTIDIIEEIGRIYSFNSFKDHLPKFKYINKISNITCLTQKIRRILRGMGIHEVVNYSTQLKQDKTSIPLINPLNKEQTTLRNNLIHNLIISKIYNINQTNYTFEAFEIGTVFVKNLQLEKNHESLHLCCILGNPTFNQITWEHNQYSLSWFQAKGHLEELFEKINADIYWSLQTNNNELTQLFTEYIHTKTKIYIKNQNKTIGILSELNSQISKKINISYPIYFFEINIYELSKTVSNKRYLHNTYLPYSQYPKITHDFSIKISTNLSIENINYIIENIQKKQKKIIESITVLNEYYHNKIIKTLCFRITYRSQDRTLTNKEIQILDKILKTKLEIDLQSKT